MNNPGLPADVNKFMDDIGRHVKLSGCLVWQEKAKIKEAMMDYRDHWSRPLVTPEALREKCLQIGMREDETRLVMDWLNKTQNGGILIPKRRIGLKWPE
ncbi:hypothetical protein [Streptomyces agglomeratus]|uniref:hypothetical protein n=1 Tax=Streptomyces agglomeratus TaxID=285458 RepID=UPI00114C9FD6|nr:hypothetical protein [Streptomyces agglomeratus]